MNEGTHLNAYLAATTPHHCTPSPCRPEAAAYLRRHRTRSARHSVAAGLHRLADRLDS